MKFKSSAYFIAAVLAVAIPAKLAAQEDHEQVHHKYKLFDLGTFGGPSSDFSDGNPPYTKLINSRGMAVGTADTATPYPYAANSCVFTPDCFVAHGFQFENGVLTDAGALPGVNSSVPFAINEREVSVGVSENGTVDPLTGLPELDPVLWLKGKIRSLGTFGGTQGVALGINDHNQVVGGALNATPDPFATVFDSNSIFLFAGTTDARGFLWQDGAMQDLGTLGGPDSVAMYVNDRGEVAGQSFLSFTPNPTSGVPTQDPFLWLPCDRDHWDNDCKSDSGSGGKSGRMLDLGTLGGTSGSAFGLNNKGQVIGKSNLAGDQTYHPFLWERGQMKDLGTLGGAFGYATWLNDKGEVVGVASLPIPCPGCEQGPQVYHGFFWRDGVMTDLGTLDKCSITFGINAKSQIVGSSGLCGMAKHAFLSEGGRPIIDLNSLVVDGSDLQLIQAIYINDHGEIAGNAVAANGDEHAYVLMPCDDDHPEVEGCEYDTVNTATMSPNDDFAPRNVGTPEMSARNDKKPNSTVRR